MGYFEGQITKYVTRHRSKKGLEDAQKAAHFAVKLHELSLGGMPPMHLIPTSEMMSDYASINGLNAQEMRVIRQVCDWMTPGDLVYLQEDIAKLMQDHYPAAAVEGDMLRGGGGFAELAMRPASAPPTIGRVSHAGMDETGGIVPPPKPTGYV